jgi:hypothetical protein
MSIRATGCVCKAAEIVVSDLDDHGWLETNTDLDKVAEIIGITINNRGEGLEYLKAIRTKDGFRIIPCDLDGLAEISAIVWSIDMLFYATKDMGCCRKAYS